MTGENQDLAALLREMTDEIKALRVAVDRLVEDNTTREIRIKLVVDE